MFALLTTVFALVPAGAEENWIALRDGVKARFLTALESTDPSKPKTLTANFLLDDPKVVADHVKVIDVADQLFGRIVLVPADTKAANSFEPIGNTGLPVIHPFLANQ